MADKITNTRSRCVAKFYNYEERSGFTSNFTKTASFIEDDAIIQCAIGRDKGSPFESFQMVLKPKMNYPDVIKPGDWVMIYLDDEKNINLKDRTGLRCIGNIDRVALNTSTNEDGSIIRTYVVSGGGIGKVFNQTEMYYNPYADQSVQQLAHLTAGYAIQGSPYDFIVGYLDLFLGDAKKQGLEDLLYSLFVPYDLYKDLQGEDREKQVAVSFYDILVRKLNDDVKEGYSFTRDISRVMSGNLWNTLQQGCNAVVNELYLDLREGKPTLIFRKQPLKKEKLLERANETINDKNYEISLDKIINLNLGTSDHEAFNFIALMPTNDLIDDKIFALAANGSKDFPRIDRSLLKRFGLRRFERNTEFAFDQSNTLGEILYTWVDELAEYWFNYYRFENGTIELRGKYDFEIGNFYLVPELNKIFMVEGVQYDWSFGSPIVVTLSVTHGLTKEGEFVDSTATTQVSEKNGLGITSYIRPNDKNFDSASSNLGLDKIAQGAKGLRNVLSNL